ncbi:DUF2059 domain-containing protein [Phaeobacter porticola]|uniref:DUF2059 domain-containing protein n=1 Tax=Phaeobacter porticola TaxID=1844006 RepID=A0A1L3I4A8_9RHOB|nr:DUF2059 domain-containing protein [Phaeobacter porticola]APG46975.1 putative protein in bacteria [Phaeobacter porticola]
MIQLKTLRTVVMQSLFGFVFASVSAFSGAQAADRDRVIAFLETTGFDVALDSIALSAEMAPDMLGIDAGDFGAAWVRLSQDVFDLTEMREVALGILEETLEEDVLAHAAEFYASPLGARLVAAENASHLVEDDETKQQAGLRIISDLVTEGSERPQLFQRMGQAIDADGTGVKAIQEIQFRFLMAASAAGVIDLQLDADGLRAFMKDQEASTQMAMQAAGMAGNAYTYQGFSDAEILTYIEALEHPMMQRVYELLNAVTFEITASRFEILAYRLQDLAPAQDL